MISPLSVLHTLTNTQAIGGFGFSYDRTIQLTLADGTLVGWPTAVRPDGTFSVALDTAQRFAGSGDRLTLSIHETDASGETTVGFAQQVTYDAILPTVTIDSGGGLTAGPVTLTGHMVASYGAGRSTGTIEILDNHLFVGLGVFNSDGSWTAEVSLRGEGPTC